ncbi:MAG: serine hydrolase [Candidatus Obscuribacterales bacterium]|nr:serine hydrolase [Candidatus Obscuribacterales bacterium]
MNRLSVKVASSISLLCMLFVLQSGKPAEAKAKGARPPQTSKVVSETLPASERTQQIANAIAEVEKLAVEQVTNKNVPGLSISVVHNGRVIYAKGFGVREINKPETVDENTVFQLASVSKSVTSSLVAKLVSEGKLTWDSRICELDPKFQMYDPWVTREITVKDLLCHRSGLPDHAGDLLEDIFDYDREQVLYRLRYQKPDSSFRSAYAYTNFGFTEGAVAAAKTTGKTFEDLCDEKVFKPLKMDSSSARYSDFIAHTNKAAGHVMVDGKWVHRKQREPDAQAPAGGVSSSARDLANWMMMEIDSGAYDGKQLIAKSAIDETHHPQILTKFNPTNGLPTFYGLGLNVGYDEHGRLHLGHSGAFTTGAGTTFELLPSERLGICVLTNAAPVGAAEGLAKTFMDIAIDGKPSRDWLALFKKVFADPATLGMDESNSYKKPPTSPTASLALADYAGIYSNDFFGDVEIVERDKSLAVLFGPKKIAFPLKHYDRDIFTYYTETEDTFGTSGLRFSMDSKGKPSNVLIENLDIRGQGLFTRSSKTNR